MPQKWSLLVNSDNSEPVQLNPPLSVELGCEIVRTAIELIVPKAAGVVPTTEHAACAAPGSISMPATGTTARPSLTHQRANQRHLVLIQIDAELHLAGLAVGQRHLQRILRLQVLQIHQSVPTDHRPRAALVMQHACAQRQFALLRVDQNDARGTDPGQRKLQQITAATTHRDALLDVGAAHVRWQVERIDFVFAAVIGAAPRHQQVTVLVSLADLLVFIAHRNVGETVGADHDKRIVDAIGGEHLPIHPHQRTAGIGPTGFGVGGAVDAGLQLH